jgi:DNA replication protein DnaC
VPCPLCDDTGWKSVELNGVARVARCDCIRESASARALADARIPSRYQHCDLDNFRDYNDSLVAAVGRARRFAEAFPVIERGLLFLGAPGLGKTHLATACLKLTIKRTSLRGVFYDTRELLRLIRDTYNPTVRATETEVLRPVMESDLLVLDDLGAEKTSEWVDETLNLIVNTRYNEKRGTIFTTNYPLQAPSEARYAETLIERIGFRMHSRLHEMCDFIVLEGVDYRELGPDPSMQELAGLQQKGSKSHKHLPSPGARTQLKSRVRSTEPAPDLKWPGGRAGS